MSEKDMIFFVGGKKFVCTTAGEATTLQVSKIIKDDINHPLHGGYKFTIEFTVEKLEADKSIADFEDLTIPTGKTYADLENVLHINEAYINNSKNPNKIVAKGGELGLFVKKSMENNLFLNFDLKINGGKTNQGGIKTNQGDL